MGCFDSVLFDCPKPECSGQVEFQSKGGDCAMISYDRNYVPLGVAADLRDSECRDCGTKFSPRATPREVTVMIKEL